MVISHSFVSAWALNKLKWIRLTVDIIKSLKNMQVFSFYFIFFRVCFAPLWGSIFKTKLNAQNASQSIRSVTFRRGIGWSAKTNSIFNKWLIAIDVKTKNKFEIFKMDQIKLKKNTSLLWMWMVLAEFVCFVCVRLTMKQHHLK